MSVAISNFSKITKSLKLKDIRTILTNSQRFSSRYVTSIDPVPNTYGGKTNVTVLLGAGIGPEITSSTIAVLEAVKAPFNYEILSISPNTSFLDFENAWTSIKRNRVALKGNMEMRRYTDNYISRNILLRKNLDLYVYVVQCRTIPGLANKFGEIDTIVIRQNTEGEYLMLEHEVRPTAVENLKVVTRYNSVRLAKFAFNYAVEKNRKMITVVHNADVHEHTEGLFLNVSELMAKDYPSIEYNVMDITNAIIKLLQNPRGFDVILATNLNGSMVCSCLNGMIGGFGLTSGSNFSEDGVAVFEPGARNIGASIVGKGIANPCSMIMAGINLLDYLGYKNKADIIRTALRSTLVGDKILTPDLGGTATTKDITENVIRHVKTNLPRPSPHKAVLHRPRWKIHSLMDINDDFKHN